MNVHPERAASHRSIAETGALPYAPMAMPEQRLERRYEWRALLRLLSHPWMVWK